MGVGRFALWTARWSPLLAVGSMVAACTPAGSAKHAYRNDVAAAAELLDADRAFARDTEDHGIDGWIDSFTDDGVELPTGLPIAEGKVAVRDVMLPLLKDPTNKLRWEPDRAFVAAAGDLGYTLGHSTLSKTLPGGTETVLAKLKYVTVWKRQPDGHWKVAAEAGTADP